MDFGEGKARKDAGVQQVLANEPEPWKDVAYRNVMEFLRSHGSFCSDDLYRFNLIPYKPHHHNAIGALMNQIKKSGCVEFMGMMKTQRAPGHIRLIPVYRSTIFERRSGGNIHVAA